MRNKEKTDKRLINSIEEVDIAFKLLSDKRQLEELYKGIYILLDKLGSAEVKELFDRYPRLMQKYSIKEMFSGNIEIPDVNLQSLKIAGLLTCLQYLISSLPEFIDESGHCIPFKEDEDSIYYQAENYILNSVSLDDYVKEIFLTIVSVTGKEYYQKFSEKIGTTDFTMDDILKLEDDVELQEHLDLAWGFLVRLFLEALYFYFNPDNHNPKFH